MASYDFDPRSGRYHIRFRWGRAFKRPLKLDGEAQARTICGNVDETITLLKRGVIAIPDGADVGAFILSGGKVAGKPKILPAEVSEPAAQRLTLGDLWDIYLEKIPERSKEATTRATEGYHRAHLLRILGERFVLETLELGHLQEYARRRQQETWRKKKIGPKTVLKEIATLRVLWNWGRKFRLLASPFPVRIGDLEFQRTADRAPFQTREQILRIIERAKKGKKPLTTGEEASLWECLYLALDEVHELLEHVRQSATHPFIYPMFVFAAMTGARRSEICRSRIEDFDFENRTVTVREKKRKRGTDSFRKVDLSSHLCDVMSAWIEKHPGGPFTISKDGEPVTVDMATDHFKRTLSMSKWSVVPGFHTLRHSFASILASQGVDEPTIDKWMGHQTPEQRERYRHLFPKALKRSIELLAKGPDSGSASVPDAR